MKRLFGKVLVPVVIAASLVLGGCSIEDAKEIMSTTLSSTSEATDNTDANSVDAVDESSEEYAATENQKQSEENLSSSTSTVSTSSLIDTTSLFSDRDLEQEADLSEASYITLSSSEDVTITEEGVYVLSGTASDTTVIVSADDTAKVQLVLDGVSISNSDFPAIYVKSADKVFVTTTDSSNTLEVTGSFTADGTTNTDAVIFSKEDLVNLRLANGESAVVKTIICRWVKEEKIVKIDTNLWQKC